MVIHIHYRGKISKPEMLPKLIEEVEEIAKVNKWPYTIYNRNFPKNKFTVKGYDGELYGIAFTPPECERVPICFLSNGRISDLSNIKIYANHEELELRTFLYLVSVVTMYAGYEVHANIIHLFRYLNDKYFARLKMKDESLYWDTNDREVLIDSFDKYNKFLKDFKAAIRRFPMLSEETKGHYLERIINYIENNK